ncbi:MAG TPA: SDR family oxidoreductase [Blastocatellia bacterium]|nr:SDR family oxidoreductase [Blastocatellia bacterium]
MIAFVTGSTGLLGNNLVRLLVQQGHQVKALVRSPEKASKLFGGLDVKFVKGDMDRIGDFASELDGCTVLFHTAAYFREYYQPGDHWEKLEKINVHGTVELLTEAEKRGIQKVIYVSSAGVIGMNQGGQPGDESSPPPVIANSNLYFKSKVRAEEAVLGFVKTHSLPVVLVLPGFMFGPGDAAPTASGQIILDYLKKKIPGIVDGGADIVDARDVAQAMIVSVDTGKSGERYIVAGTYAEVEDILKTLEKVTGVPYPRMRIPHAVIMVYAWAMEMYGRLTGKPILISRQGVQTLHAKTALNSGKALRELRASFRPLETTLKDEVEWYKEHSYA